MTENQVLKDPIVYTGKGFYAWRVIYCGALSSRIYETEAQARAALAALAKAQAPLPPPAKRRLALDQLLNRAMKHWLDDKQGHTLYSAVDKAILESKDMVRHIEDGDGKSMHDCFASWRLVLAKEILRRTGMTKFRQVADTQDRKAVVKMILQEAAS